MILSVVRILKYCSCTIVAGKHSILKDKHVLSAGTTPESFSVLSVSVMPFVCAASFFSVFHYNRILPWIYFQKPIIWFTENYSRQQRYRSIIYPLELMTYIDGMQVNVIYSWDVWCKKFIPSLCSLNLHKENAVLMNHCWRLINIFYQESLGVSSKSRLCLKLLIRVGLQVKQLIVIVSFPCVPDNCVNRYC